MNVISKDNMQLAIFRDLIKVCFKRNAIRRNKKKKEYLNALFKDFSGRIAHPLLHNLTPVVGVSDRVAYTAFNKISYSVLTANLLFRSKPSTVCSSSASLAISQKVSSTLYFLLIILNLSLTILAFI